MNENCACSSGRHCRTAAPARAREILRSDFKSDAIEDAVGSSPAEDSSDREARIAELRRRVQNGTYQINAEELSARIIDEHMES